MLLKRSNGDYLGIAWNLEKSGKIKLSLPSHNNEYHILTRTVDEETCNPLKVWHDIGEPAYLNEECKKLLKEASRPYLKTDRLISENGQLNIELCLSKNAVVYFEINAGSVNSDRGYDYSKVPCESR